MKGASNSGSSRKSREGPLAFAAAAPSKQGADTEHQTAGKQTAPKAHSAAPHGSTHSLTSASDNTASNGYTDQIQQLQMALQEVTLLQETAAAKSAAAEIAQQLAVKQTQAINAVLSRTTDAAALTELERGIAMVERAQNTAKNLRAEAQQLVAQSEAKAAAAAQEMERLSALVDQQQQQLGGTDVQEDYEVPGTTPSAAATAGPETLKAAMALAAEANKVVEELMGKGAGAGPDSSSSSSSASATPKDDPAAAAVTEALARDLARRDTLKAALGEDFDLSTLFKVDEGSPQGKPVDGADGGRASDALQTITTAPAHHQQQQQHGWQRQEEAEDLDDSSTRVVDESTPQGIQMEQPGPEDHGRTGRPHAAGQQQQPDASAKEPASERDILQLAIDYHKFLARAAADLAESKVPATDAPAPTGTDVHIKQLVRFFGEALASLGGVERIALLKLPADAAIGVMRHVETGSPIVRLESDLTRILAPSQSAQLDALLTAQMQDISEDMVRQVSPLLHLMHARSETSGLCQRPVSVRTCCCQQTPVIGSAIRTLEATMLPPAPPSPPFRWLESAAHLATGTHVGWIVTGSQRLAD
jgi:hypothetical protein